MPTACCPTDAAKGARRSVADVDARHLSNSVNYHVTVSPQQAAHVDNYYSLSLDTDASLSRGDLRLWDGSHMDRRESNGSMPFKVWGTMDDKDQRNHYHGHRRDVQRQYLRQRGGVRARKIRDGRTANENCARLIEMGNSAGPTHDSHLDRQRDVGLGLH